MRYTILAAAVLTAGMAMPSLAATRHAAAASDLYAEETAGTPSYDECFKLGWVRGVHVERGEWDDFYSQCAGGQVPFDSGMPVDSVKLDHVRHSPHS